MSSYERNKVTVKRKAPPTRVDAFEDTFDAFTSGDTPEKPTKVKLEYEAKPKVNITPEISPTPTNAEGWFTPEPRKVRRVAMTFSLAPATIALIDQASAENNTSRSKIVERMAEKILGKR